ncbi:MAG: DUF4197 domain-containing protein [Alphaproteobacteria bacterium]|nr:DUF4197 domain-containing protein [Alphaproteobacteria bacterium]
MPLIRLPSLPLTRRSLMLFAVVAIVPIASVQAGSFLDSAKSLLNQNLGSSTTPTAPGTSGLSSSEISNGLKEALRVGSKLVVDTLGANDGFNTDPIAHIPLPDQLKTAQNLLSKVGLGSLGDEVELKMNRAAEAAMKDSGEVVLNAIQAMSVDDAKGILQGPDDAATQYLARVSGDEIKAKIRPIVDQALTEVGAVDALDKMMASYKKMPFVPDVKGDLTTHATDKAYDGLFHYIAEEEASIRENPAKRTTELLQKVFSQ